jgi:geranylgeranyl reductase family protein
MADSPDVLVIGLGPAGSRAAKAAARAGCRVIAVDRRRAAGRPVQCAEFVPALLDQELAGQEGVTSQRIRAMATFVEDQAADLKGDFPGRMIDRAAFDAALVERARGAGADCRFAVAVHGIDDGGCVTLSDGSTLAPRVIIGADGPRSRVGQAIGSVNRELVETRQATVPLNAPHAATDIFLSGDFPGGYGWLFPKQTVANLGVGVAPDAKSRLPELLDALHHRLVDEGRVGHSVLALTGGAIPVGGAVRPVGTLGAVTVFLAGDAAGLANPVTGAGIAAATMSGALAGEAAAARLGGDMAAPDCYADELDALFGPSLARALTRRRELLDRYRDGARPDAAALRRGWISYPEYWAA